MSCELRFSYYTAGSGGAGPTILATSFLLLGEEVVAYRDGDVPAMPGPRAAVSLTEVTVLATGREPGRP